VADAAHNDRVTKLARGVVIIIIPFQISAAISGTLGAESAAVGEEARSRDIGESPNRESR